MTPTLFSWFNSRIAEIYRVAPSLHPAETLRQLGAPAKLSETFAALTDCEIAFKKIGEGLVPDLELREKKRKRSTGQFYTPETLAERLANMARPLESGCKVLDPACGDGSFLLAMARRLSRGCNLGAVLKQANAGNKAENKTAGQVNGQGQVNLLDSVVSTKKPDGLKARAKKRLNDALSFTEPPARLNVQLQNPRNVCLTLAEKGLSSQDEFLGQICGYDIDLQGLFICLTRLICEFPGCGWPVLEHRDFLLEPPTETFSLTIGNPPYRVNLDDAFKTRLAELYQTGEGEKDLYTFFLEGGLRALDAGGQMIMLTSHTWLVNHQCQKIRQYIFSRHRVEALMLLPARFFVTAPGVLPVVAFVDALSADAGYSVKVGSDYSEQHGWQGEYEAASTAFIPGNGLRQAIVPDALRQAFAAITSTGVKLGEVCKIGVGIQESLKREGRVSRYVSDQKLSPAHRPVLRGRELAPFKINWEGSYIDYGPHLAYAGCEKVFSGTKILYQNIRNEKLKVRLVAALDDGQFFPKNSLSFIVSETVDYPPAFLLGLLNSLPINAWFSSQFHSFHVTVMQVRQIPLPSFDREQFKKVAGYAAELTQCPAGSSEYDRAFSLLNEAVCRCYGLRKDTAGLLRQFDNFLEQAAGL